ncbi:hypothetical protein CY34DRAFT_106473 [Suillus luteus UH-Slu-Lm8-n1]|uniref:Unplaced genomic scaffold CY34scaffold_84, whole genome shotgun sequence n=1 Tax=Suillus luteus UH-Slu-Lm8-n1 TaxID=930992 RepID=A0A0D0ANA0_9AGAM|nr:hypothetical protein CY34DRAFT_106473 [Suillus luteus UH-Slu-Lm8-n1]
MLAETSGAAPAGEKDAYAHTRQLRSYAEDIQNGVSNFEGPSEEPEGGLNIQCLCKETIVKNLPHGDQRTTAKGTIIRTRNSGQLRGSESQLSSPDFLAAAPCAHFLPVGSCLIVNFILSATNTGELRGATTAVFSLTISFSYAAIGGVVLRSPRLYQNHQSTTELAGITMLFAALRGKYIVIVSGPG